jgi:uncharacterized protein YegL
VTPAKGLPAYVVLDVSGSMKPYERLLNDTLRQIYDTIDTTPAVAEFIHLSVISFSDTANVLMTMTDMDSLTSLPRVACNGLTFFAPMFRLVRERIDADLPMLAAKGVSVLRPVVFVLTDGVPVDEPEGIWEADLDMLTDPGWKSHPHLIAYGFGDASEAVLKRMKPTAAFVAEQGQENSAALGEALSSLLNSMVASAKERNLQIPEQVKGYRTVDLDVLEF